MFIRLWYCSRCPKQEAGYRITTPSELNNWLWVLGRFKKALLDSRCEKLIFMKTMVWLNSIRPLKRPVRNVLPHHLLRAALYSVQVIAKTANAYVVCIKETANLDYAASRRFRLRVRLAEAALSYATFHAKLQPYKSRNCPYVIGHLPWRAAATTAAAMDAYVLWPRCQITTQKEEDEDGIKAR